MRNLKRLPHTFALLGTLALAPAAFAQDSSASTVTPRVSVVGGYALSEPTRNPSIAGSRSQIDGDGAATLSASFHVNDNVAVEAWGTDAFGHRVKNAAGAKTASVSAQPYALSGQYHFGTPDQTVRPFVGLGYYEMNFKNETTQPGSALGGQRLGVETAKGGIATAGVDVNFGPRWFGRADVRYLQGKSDVKLNGLDAGEAQLEPVMLGVGVGARF